jgi:hypothetical protein
MLDLRSERLRHLVANAILELWKKETGSLSSVIIEGTICITTSSGKTTVVQVADRFAHGMPDYAPSVDDSGISPGGQTNLKDESGLGGVCPGTGYYTKSEDSDMEDVAEAPESSTPKQPGVKEEEEVEEPREDALDLSGRRESADLALSSPHSYTAQVREVIRQRLLASKGERSSSEENTPSRLFSHSWPGAGRTDPQHLPFPSPFTSPLSVGLPHQSFFPMRSPVFPSPELFRPTSPSSSHGDDNPVFPPSFSPETDLNGNMEKDTNEEQRVYKCEFCSKTFLFKSKYHEHLPVHTNARPFRCHLCSRTYKYKYDLRVHLRTHMGIPTKSTICPFCSSKFSTNKVLRIHIRDSHQDRQQSLSESSIVSETSPPNTV